MAVEVFMPKMTDHMEAGVIVTWLVKEGDAVEKDQPILEVETDKAVAVLDAPVAGVLKGIRPGIMPGVAVPVGETMAFLAEPGEVVPSLPPFGLSAGAVARQTESKAAAALGDDPSASGPGGIRTTPAARRIARELGVDLLLVKGTGPGGRILEQDVQNFAHAAAAKPSQSLISEVGPEKDFEWQQLSTTERLTGQRMVESVRSAPQFSVMANVDMTRVLELRSAIMSVVETEAGARLSITGILVKIVAGTLQDHPRANASFTDGQLRIHKHINVGVAVGADDGLVVPVIRDANRKSLAQITRELGLFREKAMTKRFGLDDLTGGTFTVSNLGMYGVDSFQAILNPPESAILAVGRIVKTPVGMQDDTIMLRPILSLTLTVDHRTMDGIAAAKFLGTIKERLEQPHLKL